MNLATTFQNVPPENILNYDKTISTDDLENTLVITIKGTKKVDWVMDTSKQSTSLMFAMTAGDQTLPPYVFYKGCTSHNVRVDQQEQRTIEVNKDGLKELDIRTLVSGYSSVTSSPSW
mgnify:FL=1